MIIPIRCFSCNKPIADKYTAYLNELSKKDGKKNTIINTNLIENGNIEKSNQALILDELGIHRFCCRRMFLTQVDIVDII
tara:strand:- start:126 stop:365 length:240 start_codon:yes stop_codon:yes gene_type:complete